MGEQKTSLALPPPPQKKRVQQNQHLGASWESASKRGFFNALLDITLSHAIPMPFPQLCFPDWCLFWYNEGEFGQWHGWVQHWWWLQKGDEWRHILPSSWNDQSHDYLIMSHHWTIITWQISDRRGHWLSHAFGSVGGKGGEVLPGWEGINNIMNSDVSFLEFWKWFSWVLMMV